MYLNDQLSVRKSDTFKLKKFKKGKFEQVPSTVVLLFTSTVGFNFFFLILILEFYSHKNCS